MIPQTFVQELLNRVDIVEVIGRYVPLKKGGANFIGLCPFHSEKSPSFTVSQIKQFYHCFGCGANGTAVTFLMEQGGLGFIEAVEDLANSVGLNVPREMSMNGVKEKTSQRKEILRLVDVMNCASNYYRRQLRTATLAIDYLKGRGLTGGIAAKFGLGYAPNSWQNLAAAFQDYRSDLLMEAGLVIDGDKMTRNDGLNRRYDRFRDRIIFPIRNAKGQVIGFGGRIMGNGEPKYLNSPETSLFSKGNELYGLFEARSGIRDAGYALVVEGYMDVVTLAQAGFRNALATLGTACTSMHVQKLLRQTETVVFSFDGDTPGRRAARRAMETCLPHAGDNCSFKFLFLPAEHDPDSFIRKFGAKVFSEKVNEAIPLSQFLIAEVLKGKEMHQPEGRARAFFEAKPLLQALPTNTLRSQILKEFSARAGIPLEDVINLCQLPAQPRIKNYNKALIKPEKRPVVNTARRILQNLLMYPLIANNLTDDEAQQLKVVKDYSEIFQEILKLCQDMGTQADFRYLSDLLRTSPNFATYEDVLREIMSFDENVRDLVLSSSEDEIQLDKRQEQLHLRLVEVRSAIRKLRYDGLCEALDRLYKQGSLTPEEMCHAAALSRERNELKRQLFSNNIGYS
ncbi:DNA primase [Candidatus Pandoraea novymonadis]|uniref:DNA primase n=1 Tax=Candidatus Pandoraea novymonadis TaxID=1808959 RepID=A0ABX5FEM3_9BURK|nr:DNA primase [Candidatus Pandoraea novymonadis]PSB92084.1 DNA primase [Candidatus Pandoraea novymonadis]